MLYLVLAALVLLLAISFSKTFRLRRTQQKLNNKNRHNFAKDFGITHSSRAQRVRAVLAKDMPDQCLFEDNKVYGAAFENKQPPVLPHSQTCKCGYVEADAFGSRLSTNSKNKKLKKVEEAYPSDLGSLSFYEYKYYKYSLLILRLPNHVEVRAYKHLKENLNVSSTFQKKVSQHLE